MELLGNKCSICDKAISSDATECSYAHTLEALQKTRRETNERRSSKQINPNSMFEQSLARPLSLSRTKKEMPMLIIKHRWLKNKNEVVGSTVMSFNKEGVAKIEDIGNAKIDVGIYIDNSRGLAEFVEVKDGSLIITEGVPVSIQLPPTEETVEIPKVEEVVTEIVEPSEPIIVSYEESASIDVEETVETKELLGEVLAAELETLKNVVSYGEVFNVEDIEEENKTSKKKAIKIYKKKVIKSKGE